MDHFTMPDGRRVYYYMPQAVLQEQKPAPLVLFMCGTTCDPVANCVDAGWTNLAEEEGFIVISPDYNNYATYSEVDFLLDTVNYATERFPVDESRVYATGFSNGGAASVALASEHPETFAAISAMGWMVDMRRIDTGCLMPFQVVQGSGEFTERNGAGQPEVMPDEQAAVRSLFLSNDMISSQSRPDYARTPYWGYPPASTRQLELDGFSWTIDEYYKDGYANPFAQLIICEDSAHRPRQGEARLAWDFFRPWRRNAAGQLESAD